MSWFNAYGLLFVAVILIPNLFYAAKSKGVSSSYRNRTAEKSNKSADTPRWRL